MRYYSEETVREIMDAVEDAFSDYSWGRTYVRPKLNNYPSIEIKEPHGRCIDVDALPIKDEWSLVGTDVVWDAPTVLEATEGKNK